MNKLVRLFRGVIHDLIIIITPKKILSKALSCEQVALSLVQNQENHIKKSIRIKMHMFICQCCTDYETQLNLINQSSKKIGQVNLTPEQSQVLKNSKANILKKHS